MNAIWRGTYLQRIRLASGLVLFVFAALHFLNHALGLISLEAMNTFDGSRFTVIRSVPGTIVLVLALVAHVTLTLGKVVQRRTLRMPFWEATQIIMGLAIPVFLLPHIVNTRVSSTLFGVQDTYAYELARLWPGGMASQTILMLLVWVHGCMGLHYWLRLSPTYLRLVPVLFGGAVLLPFAAFAGLSVQGRTLTAALADPEALAALKVATHWPEGLVAERILDLRSWAVNGFYAVLALALLGVVARQVLQRRNGAARVIYTSGPTVGVQPGETLLEVSRRNGVPHMAVCGGRGRCSTCRVLVLRGGDSLPAPGSLEQGTLAAIEAGRRVRLACQIRPTADVTVTPLLQAGREQAYLPSRMVEQPVAVERDLAVLFVDMRGFTTMTERKLAFDVVFILNQFFNAVGKPVYDMGGWITNYAGDGMIALFAEEAGVGAACRSALQAAAEIDHAIADLNTHLKREVGQPIRIAMGLHAGPHVVGRIGYSDAQSQSVVGLAINVASRMEVLAKQADVQIALSEVAAESAGLDTTGLRVESTDVRGLAQPIGVVFVPEARDIGERLNGKAIAAQ